MSMSDHHLGVVIPAYNEADGIAEFLIELDDAFQAWNGCVTLFVLDDASTDGTRKAVEALHPLLRARLVVHDGLRNVGHGPTVMRGYGLALAAGCDFVFQVDGDGQFEATQFWDLVDALDRAQVAVGVRRNRADPWYRICLARSLRLYLWLFFRVARLDANCPFRLYRASVLADLLRRMPEMAMIPTIYLTVLEEVRRVPVEEVTVRHRVRRGSSAMGSTWEPTDRLRALPWRLMCFATAAAWESLRVRQQLLNRG